MRENYDEEFLFDCSDYHILKTQTYWIWRELIKPTPLIEPLIIGLQTINRELNIIEHNNPNAVSSIVFEYHRCPTNPFRVVTCCI